jgi:type II secretory pathway pseudopilin PulG
VRKSRGISLLEVTLAVSVGLMLTVGGAYAYRQHMQAARITQAQLMLETMRMGIDRYKVVYSANPPLAALSANNAGNNKGFYGALGSPLRDPLYPLVNPTLSSPIKAWTNNAVAPWGGWRYDVASGSLKPNFNPADYPGHDPNKW